MMARTRKARRTLHLTLKGSRVEESVGEISKMKGCGKIQQNGEFSSNVYGTRGRRRRRRRRKN
jgi:hypothetical protein